MMRLSLALAAACIIAAPLAAAAQPPAAPPAPAAAFRPWQVDYGEYYCSMIRKAEAGRPFATAFVSIPGASTMHIALVPDVNHAAPANVSDVVLIPAGTSFHVRRGFEQTRLAPIQRLGGLPESFAEQLAGADALELRGGGRVRGRIPLAGVRDALAVQRRCMHDVAREWGLDEAAWAALRRRPEGINGLGFTTDDFPPEMLSSASQARVVLRVDVSADGRATACVPVAGTGSIAIDRRACAVVMERARFTPALDAAGAPVAARAVFLVNFRPWGSH
jgi:hypothetical protein